MNTRRRLSKTRKSRKIPQQPVTRKPFNWFTDVDNFHRYTDGLERQMTKGTKIGDVLVKAFIRWVRERHPEQAEFLFTSMAGVRVPMPIALEMQAMGSSADWPDVFFAMPRKGFAGEFIEVKYGTSRPTAGQREKLKKLIEQGYHAVAAINWTGLLKEFGEYFDIPVNPTGDIWIEQHGANP